MDPKEKEKMAEELNVEETKDTAEEQPQNDQAEEAAPLTHEEQLEKELEDPESETYFVVKDEIGRASCRERV